MLSGFYQSKAWVNLMAVIRMERVNSDGQIICEHCGKPIVHKYDCIGHHKIELNEANVNNADIALNPDNIMLVHHRCHNKIHDKLGYSNRQVFLVYGSPLSGKTTFVEGNKNEGDLVVDVDNIWQCVSGCARYTKPNRLKSCVFSVRDHMIDMVRMRQGKWLNAWVIGGYPLVSERERLLKSLGAREVFVDTSRENCVRRLRECSDGRNFEEWEKYISDWWEKFSQPLPR